MGKEVKPEEAVRRIEKVFDKRIKEIPSLKSILDPFKKLLIEREYIKAEISSRTDIDVSAPDKEQFAKGEPMLKTETIASLIDTWGETMKRSASALERSFPKIRPEITKLTQALDTGQIDVKDCLLAIFTGEDNELDGTASRLGIQPNMLRFLLIQISKPFIEKRAQRFHDLIKEMPWFKGYCPICGSSPELSFLHGKEGQRWLRCSLCGYEWRFKRTECPYCGYEGKKGKQLDYIEGRNKEWAESCPECKRYIVGTDLGASTETATEAVAPGLIYLDILAQDKGFTPIAVCAWNMVTESGE